MEIELPSILNIPPKLYPIITEFNKYRYFLIEGGRDGAKTQSVARILVYLCEKYPLRVVCGREIQNSIEESVYAVFSDLIRANNLYFEVLASKIDHKKTGASIRFRGFREQGSTNIKGMEAVDVLWVDESQAITKQTLDVIVPTIRKENAKVIWTMNRHVENDPVFSFFANRTDCLHIHIDYRDNPFCSKAMIAEAEQCKLRSLDDYCHIWLGEPLKKSEDFLFSMDLLRSSLALDMDRIGIRRRAMGIDVARFGDCETVFSLVESHGPVLWEQTHQEAYKHKGLDETIGKTLALQKNFLIDALVPDDDGIGGGLTDLLGESKEYEVMPFRSEEKSEVYANRRTEAYFKLLDWLENGWLKIINDNELIEQLLSIRYKYTHKGQKIIVSKDEMRKVGIKSPDRADALMQAVFFADSTMTPQHSGGMPNYAEMKHELNPTLQPEYSGG